MMPLKKRKLKKVGLYLLYYEEEDILEEQTPLIKKEEKKSLASKSSFRKNVKIDKLTILQNYTIFIDR